MLWKLRALSMRTKITFVFLLALFLGQDAAMAHATHTVKARASKSARTQTASVKPRKAAVRKNVRTAAPAQPKAVLRGSARRVAPKAVQNGRRGRRMASAKRVSYSVPRNVAPAFNGPSLRGSRESLENQNARVIADGLTVIANDADLRARIARKELSPLPVSPLLSVDEQLPAERRYCRPWTAAFLSDISRLHETQFHRPVNVSSAVRTVEFQKQLRRRNGNAAAAEGGLISPHLTGASVDITKKGMSPQELIWFRQHLAPLMQAGKIDVEEEFKQSCFHITVYRSYQPLTTAPKPQQAAPSVKPSTPGQAAPEQGLAAFVRRLSSGA